MYFPQYSPKCYDSVYFQGFSSCLCLMPWTEYVYHPVLKYCACIFTITPEDGRVFDEAWFILMQPEEGRGGGLLHIQWALLWAPLSITKPTDFVNSTPPFIFSSSHSVKWKSGKEVSNKSNYNSNRCHISKVSQNMTKGCF